jgi:hypothetical protein
MVGLRYYGIRIFGTLSLLKKCKIFAWLALHDKLNTRERLSRRGIVPELICPFGCTTDENLSHLLFICPHTNMV